MIVWANMGDPNASLPTCQPMMFRPMFGAFGSALAKTCVTFVSRASYERGSPRSTASSASFGRSTEPEP